MVCEGSGGWREWCVREWWVEGMMCEGSGGWREWCVKGVVGGGNGV